jgi:alpha-D-ribose 1-methylphosphonate 5-triphosphate diphosphatase PhnM
VKNRRQSLNTAIWLFAALVACGSTNSPVVGSWKNQEAIANQCDPVDVTIAFHGDGTFEDVSRVPASQWMVPIYPKCDPKQWKLATHTGTFAVDAKPFIS